MRCLQPHRTAQRQGWVSAHTSTLHTRRRPWRDAKPRLCAAKAQRSQSDCVALGNLCVDVVLPVDELPTSAPQSAERRALLSELSGQTFPEESKEVGGNLNFVIAAQRCGLAVTSIGHVGRDSYGEFMETVLQAEDPTHVLQRILSHGEATSSGQHVASAHTAPSTNGKANGHSNGHSKGNGKAQTTAKPAGTMDVDDVDQTLVCFVLVDPNSKHAFCSRYDFGPWPLLGTMSRLPEPALKCLQLTRAVFMNGFVFDELPLEVVRHACNHAKQHGAAVFFDPGPRCFTMLEGQRRQALEEVMALSEVVLMTEEEAVTVTGHTDPEKAARTVLSRPDSATQWAVVKLGANGALLVNKKTDKTYQVPGFKVEVADTVGCGDSFAAAIVLGYLNRHTTTETAVLTLANAVGAATAMGRGAGRNVASAGTVESILRSALSTPDRAQDVKGALDMLLGSRMQRV